MEKEQLSQIVETVEGYPVKDLRWLPKDNIIVGLVKCPVWGKESICEGFVSGMWRRTGIPTNRIKGRNDLTLKMDLN